MTCVTNKHTLFGAHSHLGVSGFVICGIMKVSGLWVLLLLFVFGTTFLFLNVSGRRIVSLVPGKYFPFCYFGFCLRSVCSFWCSVFQSQYVITCLGIWKCWWGWVRNLYVMFMILLMGVQNCLLIVVVLFCV